MTREALTLPVLSDTMETGQLSEWLKKPGDPVKKGEAVAEVESDKAIMEVEAFKDGFLQGPLAETGRDIPVGEVIAYIADTPDTSVEAPKTEQAAPQATQKLQAASQQKEHSQPEEKPLIEPKTAEPKTAEPKTAEPNPVEPKPNEATHSTITEEAEEAEVNIPSPKAEHTASDGLQKGIKMSPYARGLARELGVDPNTVPAAPDGIIRSPQVIAAAMQGKPADLNYGPQWHYKLFTPTHRAIADNMIATTTTPTFRVSARLPMDKLLQTASKNTISLTLLLAKALALSVKHYPQFNAAYTPLALAQRKQVDVGIAVDVPGSLLTPVLRDVVNQPITDLSNDWKALKNKIKARRISASDYKGATIYLSNLGMFKVVTQFEAIVPPGAAAILAVGAIQDDQAIFTLSCDHRVVYGADAARFLEYFSTLLEAPENWFG